MFEGLLGIIFVPIFPPLFHLARESDVSASAIDTE